MDYSLILGLVLEAVKDAPDIVSSIKATLLKGGYTNDQIDQIFQGIPSYDQLGIDPNAPDAQDAGSGAAQAPASAPPAPPAPAAAPLARAVQAVPSTSEPHISARPGMPPKPIALPGPTPPPNPFEKAR